MRATRYLTSILLCTSFLFSCTDGKKANEGKPIVLGDPSTIVTETDPQYLQDFVPDIKHAAEPAPVQPDTTATQPAPTTEQPAPQPEQKAAEAEKPAASENGLDITFNEVSLFIPGVEAKVYRQSKRADANGLSFQLNDGKLNGNHIKVKQGTVTRIMERVQSAVTVKNELGTLALNTLGGTSDWAPLSGKGDSYTISGLDVSRANARVSPAELRNAITRAMRGKRMSRLAEQKWLNSVRNVRSLNQKPLTASLRSVTWKIEGKDARGRVFQKQVRIDL